MLKQKYIFYLKSKELNDIMSYTTEYIYYRIIEEVNYIMDYGRKEDIILNIGEFEFTYMENVENNEQILIKPIPFSKSILTQESKNLIKYYLQGNNVDDNFIEYILRHILKNEKAHKNFKNIKIIRSNFENFENIEIFIDTLF